MESKWFSTENLLPAPGTLSPLLNGRGHGNNKKLHRAFCRYRIKYDQLLECNGDPSAYPTDDGIMKKITDMILNSKVDHLPAGTRSKIIAWALTAECNKTRLIKFLGLFPPSDPKMIICASSASPREDRAEAKSMDEQELQETREELQRENKDRFRERQEMLKIRKEVRRDLFHARFGDVQTRRMRREKQDECEEKGQETLEILEARYSAEQISTPFHPVENWPVLHPNISNDGNSEHSLYP